MGSLSNALAAAVAVFALLVALKWDGRENFFFNVSVLIMPYLLPVSSVVGRPREEQLAILKKVRKAWEDSAVQSTSDSIWNRAPFRHFYGPTFSDALFGPNATRIASFSVPSSSEHEGGHSIPVSCAFPHDAGPRSNLPVVLFFHSGGMITGSVKAEFHLARYVAYRARAAVCSVEYRLSPEARYPSAVEDAMDAAAALLRSPTTSDDGDGGDKNPAAEALGGVGLDVSTFATWGTSAGGYMSAHVARRLAHYRRRTAALQVSIVPMAKPHGGTRSLVENAYDPFWPAALNSYAWSAYLEGDDGTLSVDWRVSLLMDPPRETLDLLPPAYVQINSRDGLRDEGEMYAERLRQQGKLVMLKEFDATHAGGTPPFDKGTPAEGSYDRAISVLISHLHRTSRSEK